MEKSKRTFSIFTLVLAGLFFFGMACAMDYDRLLKIGHPFILTLSPLYFKLNWFPMTLTVIILAILGSGKIEFTMYYDYAKKLLEFFKKSENWKKEQPNRTENLLKQIKTEWGKKLALNSTDKHEKIYINRLEIAKKRMEKTLVRMKKLNPQSPKITEIEREFNEVKKTLKIG